MSTERYQVQDRYLTVGWGCEGHRYSVVDTITGEEVQCGSRAAAARKANKLNEG
jgi:hypothetical protein